MAPPRDRASAKHPHGPPGAPARDGSLEHLRAELERIDLLLRIQVLRARRVAGDDAFRGLAISDEDIDALFLRPIGAPHWEAAAAGPEPDGEALGALGSLRELLAERTARLAAHRHPAAHPHQGSRLCELARAFELDTLDLDLLTLALAPELDLRYERLFAYLNDNVTRKRPTVDVALGLFCTSFEERLAARARFTPASRLLRHRLIEVFADPAESRPTLLGSAYQVEPRVTAWLLGDDTDDPRRSQPLAAARRLPPTNSWEDLVVPASQLERLREICDHARFRERVFVDWGFDRKLATGKGLNLLFSGPPGTGKTLTAGIMARELGLEIFQIDLAAVISKYIGETEKHLGKLFDEAEGSGAVLFFDEADALFGKRSEVRDSHDRYANVETSYLLQRIDAYAGVVILATNFSRNLDEAFLRRFQFIVEFISPAEPERLRIWESIWPKEVPRAGDLDLELMAKRFELSGGHIRNIAVAAAFLAAAQGTSVGQHHLLHAAKREYQKLGRRVDEALFRR